MSIKTLNRSGEMPVFSIIVDRRRPVNSNIELESHAMKFMIYTISVLAIVSIAVSAVAQTDFFWSFQGLNNGAVNSDTSGDFNVGDTGTIFLYYTTNGPIDSDISVGAFLDIATTTAGVIEFTAAETFDFMLTGKINGMEFTSTRWVDSNGQGGSVGHTGSISGNGQLLDEWNAFTVGAGFGILETFTDAGFSDQGYDSNADAFLFGQLEFVAIGSGATALSTSIGDGGIINAGQFIFPTFGNASVNVSVVPEPCNLYCLTALLSGFTIRRSPSRNTASDSQSTRRSIC